MAAERRREPRTEMAVECTLQRAKGAPIRCETVDVGPGGMAVASDRPLAADEVVAFDLEAVHGQARVLREQATTSTRCASRRCARRRGRGSSGWWGAAGACAALLRPRCWQAPRALGGCAGRG